MNYTIPAAQAVGRLVRARRLEQLAHQLARSNALSVSGLWGSSIAAVTAAVEQVLHRPVLVVCGHLDEADDLADDMELFHGRRPQVVPALESGGTLGRLGEEQVSNRLRLISRLDDRARSAAGNATRFNSPALGSSSVFLRPKCSRKYSVVE